jgi:SAM-dependent methyltransferase
LEAVCRTFGHRRLLLPEADPEQVFPGFTAATVEITALAQGGWSTWLMDQVVLAKLAVALQPAAILEVGSFRGFTARLLAENTPAETSVVALDLDPDHGSSYRDLPLASKITRLVGHLGCWEELPLQGCRFDLIFLDSDHRQQGVSHDTAIALRLLSPAGVLVWHDYKDFGWLDGSNRVPEVLASLAADLPIYALPGCNLAVYGKGWEQIASLPHGAPPAPPPAAEDPWTTQRYKG